MQISRRQLAQLGLASAATLPLRRGRAASGERKFLFFFAGGGWDTTCVFDPHFEVADVDMDDLAEPGEENGIAFTGGSDRPNVTRFFSRWGHRACVVNGLNAHSVGHDSATQFMMTGTSASSYPDWPAILAGATERAYPLPHVVFGGPSYPGSYGGAVVRAGGGALLDLLDASVMGQADRPQSPFQTPADSMIDAFVHRRVAAYAANRSGLGRARADAYLENVERDMELEGRRFEAGLTDLGSTMVDQGVKAAEMIRLGLCRCATISVDGGFDTHSTPSQADDFDAWFAALDAIMEHLATTPGLDTARLVDEVVVVGLSEFGRTPKYNGGNGRDHWPYGSAIVMGSGVAGGQRVGYTDDTLVAMPIDLSTGEPRSDGDIPGCENLGVALLELGGIDPAQHLPDVPSLAAIRSGA